MSPVTTQQKSGAVRHGDFYPGFLAVIKGSTFVNFTDSDSDRSQKFIRKRIQKAVK
jgi:hypothetical protein